MIYAPSRVCPGRLHSRCGRTGENQISLTDPDSRAMAAHTQCCGWLQVSAIAPWTNCFALKSKPIRQGARAPLEPKRGKGLKVQDVTRVFWPRGTLRWCSERTWGDCGG